MGVVMGGPWNVSDLAANCSERARNPSSSSRSADKGRET